MFDIQAWQIEMSYAFTNLINGADLDDAIDTLEDTKEFIDTLIDLLDE